MTAEKKVESTTTSAGKGVEATIISAEHLAKEFKEHSVAEFFKKNKQMLNLLFRLGLQHTYGPATEKVREAYFPFLRSCPLAVRLPGDVFISHSAPDAVDERPFDPTIFSREIERSESTRLNSSHIPLSRMPSSA